MPRPNRNRKVISLYVGESGLAAIDALAKRFQVTRSDVIRLAVKHGMKAAEKELAREE